MQDTLPLKDHQFFTRLVDLTAAFVRETFVAPTADNPWEFRQSRASLSHEEYGHAVFLALAEVAQVLQQIMYTPALLTSYRSTSSLRRVGVTRFEYLVYHLENWYLRCAALLDRSLILTNEVCRLGFRNRDCKFQLIATNAHISGSPIYGSLVALEKHLRGVRETRNTIAHQRRLRPDGWNELEGISIVAHTDPEVVPRGRLKKLLDDAVAARGAEVGKHILNSIALTEDLLTALLPRFEEQYARALDNKHWFGEG